MKIDRKTLAAIREVDPDLADELLAVEAAHRTDDAVRMRMVFQRNATPFERGTDPHTKEEVWVQYMN